MYLLAREARVRKGEGNGMLRRVNCDGEKTLTLSCSYREMQFLPKVHTKAFRNPLQFIIGTRESNDT